MKLLSLLSIVSLGSAVRVSYDTGYDNSARGLDALACSDGKNGLITRYGWKTQGQIPHFPSIGGSDAVAGWNSPSCGTCWQLEYKGRKVYVLAVDHADSGFNIGLGALNKLTGNKGTQLGHVDAKATKVAVKNCGL